MSSNTHCFSVSLAEKVGLECAIILQHFYTWHEGNAENESMIKDGNIWFFLSRKSILKVFPYLTDRKVRTSIDNMIEKGYIIKGNFNQDSFKKANWYSLTPEGLAFFNETTNPLVKTTNDWTKRPLEYSNKDILNNNKETIVNNSKEKEPKVKFAEFVSMTSMEYDKLKAELGEKGANECIEILDNYKGSSGKKYASDYRAIRVWVIDRLKEKQQQCPSPNKPVTPSPSQLPKWKAMGFKSEEEYLNRNKR